MTEESKQAPGAETFEDKTYVEILRSFVGKIVTIVNPESYEVAPMGFKLGEGFYRGKLTALGRDYVVMMTQIERKKGQAEPVKQWIPISRVKRISVMKTDRILHL